LLEGLPERIEPQSTPESEGIPEAQRLLDTCLSAHQAFAILGGARLSFTARWASTERDLGALAP